MLARLRLSPQQLWWALILIPTFLILNGWAIDLLIHFELFLARGFSRSIVAYIWWARYDLFVKWLIPFIIASLLISNHARLKQSTDDFKLFVPWIVTIALLSFECAYRQFALETSQTGFNRPRPGGISWSLVVNPPEILGRNGYRWRQIDSSMAYYWEIRPLVAFLVVSFLLWAVRTVWARVIMPRFARFEARSEIA